MLALVCTANTPIRSESADKSILSGTPLSVLIALNEWTGESLYLELIAATNKAIAINCKVLLAM